jgi:hypothetical protein
LKDEIEKKNQLYKIIQNKKTTIKRIRIKIKMKNKFYIHWKVKLKRKINLGKGLKNKK